MATLRVRMNPTAISMTKGILCRYFSISFPKVSTPDETRLKAEMISLNGSFKDAIIGALQRNPSVDLALHLFPQYQAHLRRIVQKFGPEDKPPPPPPRLPKIGESVKSINPLFSTKIDDESGHAKSSSLVPSFSNQPPTSEPKSSQAQSSFSSDSKPVAPFESQIKIAGEPVETTISAPAHQDTLGHPQTSIFSLFASTPAPPSPLQFNFGATTSLPSTAPATGPSSFLNSFGSPSTTAQGTGLFSFGSFGSSSEKSAPNSSNPFASTFQASPLFEAKQEAREKEQEHETDDEKEVSVDVSRRPPEDNPLIKTGEGEEDDQCLFESRSKLFVRPLANSTESQGSHPQTPWDDLGVGIAKVNLCPDGRRRFIFRLEGSGRTLMNNWIDSSFSAERRGRDVLLFAPNSNGQIRPYLLRTKDETIASEFLQTAKKA